MGSPGSREAILKAKENIERHVQHCDQQKSGEPGKGRGKTPRRHESIANRQGFRRDTQHFTYLEPRDQER